MKEQPFDVCLLAVTNGWLDVYEQLLDMGNPKAKIALVIGWSRIDYYVDELDRYFDISKKPFLPFEKKPVVSLGHCGENQKKHGCVERRKAFL